MTLVPGDRLGGRYLVQRALGGGGMGSVFLALELPTGATRVLKQLRVDRPELVEAFRSEFALLSSITDPHLMRVHDFGTSHVRGESISYYVAEWIDGQTFSTFAKEASLSNLTSALLDAVSGLSALHAIGVRHGDFTPGNVLVDRRGRGTLIDLGCARPFSHRSSSIAGTPGYFAPELLSEGGGDARADLFSVGITLRRALEIAGQTPSASLAHWIERLTAAAPGHRPESAM
ncbi:MAG TPA: serine/threonine-protein kinase, partial [Polyangiaceae bacterium]